MPGQNVAVAGYDDSDAAKVTDPPLTSVSVPFFSRWAGSPRINCWTVSNRAERIFFFEKSFLYGWLCGNRATFYNFQLKRLHTWRRPGIQVDM